MAFGLRGYLGAEELARRQGVSLADLLEGGAQRQASTAQPRGGTIQPGLLTPLEFGQLTQGSLNPSTYNGGGTSTPPDVTPPPVATPPAASPPLVAPSIPSSLNDLLTKPYPGTPPITYPSAAPPAAPPAAAPPVQPPTINTPPSAPASAPRENMGGFPAIPQETLDSPRFETRGNWEGTAPTQASWATEGLGRVGMNPSQLAAIEDAQSMEQVLRELGYNGPGLEELDVSNPVSQADWGGDPRRYLNIGEFNVGMLAERYKRYPKELADRLTLDELQTGGYV